MDEEFVCSICQNTVKTNEAPSGEKTYEVRICEECLRIFGALGSEEP